MVEDGQVTPIDGSSSSGNPPRWSRTIGSTPTSQWSTGHRVVFLLGLALFLPASFAIAVGGPHHRGAWVGAVVVIIYVVMLGGPLVSRRFTQWFRKHPYVDAAMIGPLIFALTVLYTPLALVWCAVLAVAGSAILLVLVRRRRGPRVQGEVGVRDDPDEFRDD